jgi:hypothetical protein
MYKYKKMRAGEQFSSKYAFALDSEEEEVQEKISPNFLKWEESDFSFAQRPAN